ncbi:MAG: 30S ribosomal protein S20 [Candidatus Shikimatogenerans bostrichidophilus]|nr:MAG: 30S ribosomal protein S20 [Candidatus Shikimatogenerans bostrichidophilus]
MSSISVLKRKRKNIKKKIYNKYRYKTAKTLIKKFKKLLLINKIDKKEKIQNLYKIYSIIDKLKKKRIIHLNKASRIKSKLSNLLNKY